MDFSGRIVCFTTNVAVSLSTTTIRNLNDRDSFILIVCERADPVMASSNQGAYSRMILSVLFVEFTKQVDSRVSVFGVAFVIDDFSSTSYDVERVVRCFVCVRSRRIQFI